MIAPLLGFDGQCSGWENCESTGSTVLLWINTKRISATTEHDPEVIWVSFPVPETHPLLSALSCTDISCVKLLPVKVQDLYGLSVSGLSVTWYRPVNLTVVVQRHHLSRIDLSCQGRLQQQKKKSRAFCADTNINSALLCRQHSRKWGSLGALLAKAASLTCAVNPTLTVEGGLRQREVLTY